MDEKIRINKYLSDAGVCSRREADRLTEAGRVTVRGTVVSTGEKIFPDEETNKETGKKDSASFS